MSHKRKHTESGDVESTSFKKQRPFKPNGAHQQPHHKKRPQVSTDIDKTPSTHALKSRIRDLKRLLAHVDNVGDHKMSAGNKVERERELEACEHELEEKIAASREAEYRNKMIGKYHQVRFFDRQKGTRILKRLKKTLKNTEDEEEKTQLEHKVHNAEVDVNYAIYYPLMKPYSSLYPKSKNGKGADVDQEDEETKEKNGESTEGPKGDVEMWKTVDNAMRDGSLDALRNSKQNIPTAPAKKEKKPEKKKKETMSSRKESREDRSMPEPTLNQPSNRRERRAQAAKEDEDSDGGFFE